MMAGKLSGLQQSIRRTEQIVDNITAVKAIRALKSATYIIRTESATMTPIDTSTLINSQYDTVEINGMLITGKIGYSSNYALYVHNASGKLKGKPRPSGRGNFWSPHAEPKFLTKAAEKTQSLVDSTIRREMKI